MNKDFILTGGTIVNYNQVIQDGYIIIKNGRITEVGQGQISSDRNGGFPVIPVEPDSYIFPGFIDVHIHGTAGADVMDASEQALDQICRHLPREGTTSFLATTITQHPDTINDALSNVRLFMNKPYTGAEILGVHLEGPFISPKQPGAQPVQYIQTPDIKLFDRWQHTAGGHIRLVTMAPEESNGMPLVKHLNQKGVIVSIGHSHASFLEGKQSVEAGVRHATHLFNAMRPMHHREPGVAGMVLLDDSVTAEIILDGIHVQEEMVQLAYQLKGSQRLQLITDAIRAKCLKDGQYELGGEMVFVKENEARRQDGTLAGSVLKMNEAVKKASRLQNCHLTDLVRMSSYNASVELGINHRKGSIEKGKDADIVILNNQFQVLKTFCRGKMAFDMEME